MGLSQLARSIAESPTLKLNATAVRLRAAGEPIIHLGGGEPKAKAPLEAIAHCTTQLQTGEVRYGPADGLPALKQAIAQYTEEQYQKVVAPGNIVVSSGAKQAIMSVLQCVLDPGDEVLFPAPYWVSYPEMVKIAGGVPRIVTPKDGGFRPTLGEMTDAIGRATKAIILNSPNNPSGVLYSRDFIADLVEFCDEQEIYLIMDDIYNRLLFDGKRAPNPYEFTHVELDRSRLVVVQGVSKMYAMTGFRIGWAIVHRDLAQAMSNLQSHTTSGPATPSQWAAVGALNGLQAPIDSLRSTLEKNRNLMVERLGTIAGVNVHVPDGTFYCFPDFRAYECESQKLAELLLDKVRVVVVPGKEFGMDGYLRLSFCGTSEEIVEGVDRIRWALDPNAPEELQLGNRRLMRDRIPN